MIGKGKKPAKYNPSVIKNTKNNHAGGGAELLSVDKEHTHEAGRPLSSAEKLQIKIEHALGLQPVSRIKNDSINSFKNSYDVMSDSAPANEIHLQECLDLMRSFSKIRDPKARRRLLQMAEDAASRE